MLKIVNREDVWERGKLVPLVEQVALCISSGAAVRAITSESALADRTKGWVVFHDQEGRGFGVNLCGFTPQATLLRRRVCHVTTAQRLARCFGGPQLMPLHLALGEQCPSDWRVYRTVVKAGSFLCAASVPPPAVEFQGLHVSRAIPRIRLALTGIVPIDTTLGPGSTIHWSRIGIEVASQMIQGALSITKEGTMSIQCERIEGGAIDDTGRVYARLDLGEIDLSLEEVVSLRTGGMIELEASLPLRCFIRVGSTIIAEADLTVKEGLVSLHVTNIVG